MSIVPVSIIIANYNTLHVLMPCLDSIIERTTGYRKYEDDLKAFIQRTLPFTILNFNLICND